MDWIELNNKTKLDELLEVSQLSKVVIFKHSTSCGISSMVLRNFEKEVAKLPEANTHYYFLDLIAHRDLSNAIAQTLDVHHESPQMIILEKGVVTHHSSHSNITAGAIQDVAP